jgi:hypothetical protein
MDIGRLEAAEALLVEMRSEPDLTPYELAYSYLTEERLAYERGDRMAQLRALRKAMLGNGRWLAEDAYLECLRTAVVLEIEVGDFASALRDYELLTDSRKGRELAADLEQYIAAVQERLEGAELGVGPYLVADSGVAVNKTRIRRGQGWTTSGGQRRPDLVPIPVNRTPSPPSNTTPSAPSPPSSPRPPPPVDK